MNYYVVGSTGRVLEVETDKPKDVLMTYYQRIYVASGTDYNKWLGKQEEQYGTLDSSEILKGLIKNKVLFPLGKSADEYYGLLSKMKLNTITDKEEKRLIELGGN